MYTKGCPVEIHTPNAKEPDRPQHDGPIASVIAQQYSFASFVSLRFSEILLLQVFFCLLKLLKSELP
jgi:hypothetical protein